MGHYMNDGAGNTVSGGQRREIGEAEIREYAQFAAELLKQNGIECEGMRYRQEEYTERVKTGFLSWQTVKKYRQIPVTGVWLLYQEVEERSDESGWVTVSYESCWECVLTSGGQLMYADIRTMRPADREMEFYKNEWTEQYDSTSADRLAKYLGGHGINLTVDQYMDRSAVPRSEEKRPAAPARSYSAADRDWLLKAIYHNYTKDIFDAAEVLGIQMISASEVDDMDAQDIARLLTVIDGREPRRPADNI